MRIHEREKVVIHFGEWSVYQWHGEGKAPYGPRSSDQEPTIKLTEWTLGMFDFERYSTLEQFTRRTPSDAYGFYLYFELASYSDYGGSTVERSNYEFVVNDLDLQIQVLPILGDFGSRIILIPLWVDFDSEVRMTILDILLDLTDYPLICDQTLSELEFNIALESVMDGWIHDKLRDFELEDSIGAEGLALELMSSGELIFEDAVSCYIDEGKLEEIIFRVA